MARAQDKSNNNAWKSFSDHAKSSPSLDHQQPHPISSPARIVTPLSIFKRRPKPFKNKVSDVSETTDQRSGTSPVRVDDESSTRSRSSVRSFRFGMRRSTAIPSGDRTIDNARHDQQLFEKEQKLELVSAPPVPSLPDYVNTAANRITLTLHESQKNEPILVHHCDDLPSTSLQPKLDHDELLSFSTATMECKSSRDKEPLVESTIQDMFIVSPDTENIRREEQEKTHSDRRHSYSSSLNSAEDERKEKNKKKSDRKSSRKSRSRDIDETRPGSGFRSPAKPIKIFLLLLQPKSRIFELIRVACHPQGTTVPAVLSLISTSATEAALASQEYLGLCRPSDGCDVTDADGYVQVQRGEILVAIPKGYESATIAAIGLRILSNPKVVKLLKRSEQSSRKRRNPRTINRVETVPEHEALSGDGKSPTTSTDATMNHAAPLAAGADVVNDAPFSRLRRTAPSTKRLLDASNCSGETVWPDSQISSSDDGSFSLGSLRPRSILQTTFSVDSTDDSYSTWSKSLDYSFTAPSTHLTTGSVTSQTSRRRHRRNQRLIYTKNFFIVALALMILRYCLDPRGRGKFVDETTTVPMGLLGLIQAIMLFWSICKIQKWIRRRRSNKTALSWESRNRSMKRRSVRMVHSSTSSTESLHRLNQQPYFSSRSSSLVLS